MPTDRSFALRIRPTERTTIYCIIIDHQNTNAIDMYVLSLMLQPNAD